MNENEIRTSDLIYEINLLNERIGGIEEEMYTHNDISLRLTQQRSFKRLMAKRHSMLVELKALIMAEIEQVELGEDER